MEIIFNGLMVGKIWLILRPLYFGCRRRTDGYLSNGKQIRGEVVCRAFRWESIRLEYHERPFDYELALPITDGSTAFCD